MSVTPTAHAASHGSGGNDAVTSLGDHASGAITLTEQTAPANPAANKVTLFAKDNGAGKTQLMAIFPTGAAVQVAIEV